MQKQFILYLLLLPLAAGAQTKTWWSPEQTMKMKNITAVRVSPDGRQVVYAVREAVMTEDRSEYVNQLYLTDASGNNPVRLSRGDRNNSNPRWSPDGRSIAFISNRDGKSNLYVLPVSGGESERLTDVKTAVSDFQWRPDGKAIAYLMSDAPSEAEERQKKTKEDWYFMNETYKQGRIYVIWLNEKDTIGKQKTLNITKENRHVSSLNWSPDGNWIVYTHALSPIAHDNVYSDIAMVNVSTGEIKNVAITKGGEEQPFFSPDGKSIAYVANNEEGIWAGSIFIKVVPASGGTAVTLATAPNDHYQLLGWSADGKWVYALAPYHTTTKVFRFRTDGKTLEEWNTGNPDVISNLDLNNKSTHFGFVLQNTTRPGDAYVSTTTAFVPRKVSNINPEIASYPVPKTEVIRWKSTDGKEIEGLLTYPLNYEAGKKYPFVLNIHGGPAGVFAESFIASNSGAYPLAALAEKGFFILRPNPRGSDGYGPDFRLANQRDWGGADYQDLMSGVDAVISKGLVDSTKMGVMGWSYGGFMSSWVVGHTNRFKAASIGAPVVELVAFDMTNDIGGFVPSYMKKQSWEDWEIYNTHSPLRYINNVSTPVLLQQGEADVRVPFSQGVMYYTALKRRGVPVRFLVLPRQGHGPTEPKMILKIQQTNLEWMQHYLQGSTIGF